jgi:hypothetical protein
MESGMAAIVRRFTGFMRAAECLAAVRVAEMRVRGRTLKGVADGVVIGDGELRGLMSFNQQEREINFSRNGGLQFLPVGETLQFFVLEFGALDGGYLFHAESERGLGCTRCAVMGQSGV